MLTLTPAVCVLAGIGFSYTFEKYLKDDEVRDRSGSQPTNAKDEKLYDKAAKNVKSKVDPVGVSGSSGSSCLVSVVFVFLCFFCLCYYFCVQSVSLSFSTKVVFQIIILELF